MINEQSTAERSLWRGKLHISMISPGRWHAWCDVRLPDGYIQGYEATGDTDVSALAALKAAVAGEDGWTW